MVSVRESTTFNLNSHQTALCILPPPEIADEIDRLRRVHDKAYGKWPPHINLLYPFVGKDKLEEAANYIEGSLRALGVESMPTATLTKTDFFTHRQSSTVFLHPQEPSEDQSALSIEDLHDRLATVLSSRHERGSAGDVPFRPHLSIGQSPLNTAMRADLMSKAQLLLPLTWKVTTLAVYVREHVKGGSEMKLWRKIQVPSHGNEPDSGCESRVEYHEAAQDW